MREDLDREPSEAMSTPRSVRMAQGNRLCRPCFHAYLGLPTQGTVLRKFQVSKGLIFARESISLPVKLVYCSNDALHSVFCIA